MAHRSAAAIILSLICAGPAFAQRNFDDVEITTSKVADGVYMLQGAGGNIGLSVGEDGAFVIDDQFAPLSEKIMKAIEAVTDKPVEFLLNTHYHGDHTGGNQAFGEAGAHIVAHDNVRKRMMQPNARPDGSTTPASPEGALPIITFSEAMSFHWNGQDIRIWHQAPAHTDGDAIIYFKTANVVHMGDIFMNGGYPFVDVSSGGNLAGYIAYCDKVLSKVDDSVKIIPGHGPLASKADLEAYAEMLKAVTRLIQSEIDAGKSEDETVAADPLTSLSGKWGQGFINGEAMTRAAYKSLTAGHGHEH